MLCFNLVPHPQNSSDPGISYTCASSLKAHWRAGVTLGSIRISWDQTLLPGVYFLNGWCSSQPGPVALLFWTPVCAFYICGNRYKFVIGCNSKPLSLRAARSARDAEPGGVGLTLCLLSLSEHSAQVTRRVLPRCLCVLFGRASGTLPSWQP